METPAKTEHTVQFHHNLPDSAFPSAYSERPFAASEDANVQITVGDGTTEQANMSLSEFRRACNGMKLLSLFHRFRRPEDGIEFFAERFGVEIDAYDTEIDAAHNLPDEGLWSRLLERIHNKEYAGGVGGAPCSTFSATRNANDGGPVPLRGPWAPDFCGLKHIKPAEKEQVRLGTLLAHRKAEAFAAFGQIQRPFWAETPARRDNAPSVFNLPVWLEFIAMPDVLMSSLAQCMLGSWFTKPTDMFHFLMLLKLPAVCTHPPHWRRMPWNGVWRWASHSPLRGRQWMVPAHTWHRSMLMGGHHVVLTLAVVPQLTQRT